MAPTPKKSKQPAHNKKQQVEPLRKGSLKNSLSKVRRRLTKAGRMEAPAKEEGDWYSQTAESEADIKLDLDAIWEEVVDIKYQEHVWPIAISALDQLISRVAEDENTREVIEALPHSEVLDSFKALATAEKHLNELIAQYYNNEPFSQDDMRSLYTLQTELLTHVGKINAMMPNDKSVLIDKDAYSQLCQQAQDIINNIIDLSYDTQQSHDSYEQPQEQAQPEDSALDSLSSYAESNEMPDLPPLPQKPSADPQAQSPVSSQEPQSPPQQPSHDKIPRDGLKAMRKKVSSALKPVTTSGMAVKLKIRHRKWKASLKSDGLKGSHEGPAAQAHSPVSSQEPQSPPQQPSHDKSQRDVFKGMRKKVSSALKPVTTSGGAVKLKIKYRKWKASLKSDDLKGSHEGPAAQTEQNTVASYLKDVQIPEEVQTLSKIGVERYQNAEENNLPDLKSNQGERRGGRTESWLDDTFGIDNAEQKITEELSDIPAPATFTCGEIQAQANTFDAKKTTDAKTNFHLVQGVSANDLQSSALGQDAVVQVASQFNFLEAMSAGTIMDVSKYTKDLTQGPQMSIEACAAAIHRKAAFADHPERHALAKLGIPQEILDKCYKNGYLEPDKLTSKQKKTLLACIKKNVDQLTVLPQWVTCERSGVNQLQVFTAAPSYQVSSTDKQTKLDIEICKALVVAQYTATAQLALIRSQQIGQPVPLHLTMVGQGAFKNDPSIMKEAMEAVNDVLSGSQVQVFVHAFSDADKNKMQRQLSDGSIAYTEMSANDFFDSPKLGAAVSSPTVKPITDVKSFDWGNGFHVQGLHNLCKKEYSLENLDFISSCAKLAQLEQNPSADNAQLKALQEHIYNQFLTKSAVGLEHPSMPINIESSIEKELEDLVKDASDVNTQNLNGALKGVFRTLQDTLARYCCSEEKNVMPSELSTEVQEFMANDGAAFVHNVILSKRSKDTAEATTAPAQPIIEAPTNFNDFESKSEQAQAAQQQTAGQEAKATQPEASQVAPLTFQEKIQEKREQIIGQKKEKANQEQKQIQKDKPEQEWQEGISPSQKNKNKL